MDWWKLWVEAMGKDLPDRFSICGIGNGGFQAGLYASEASEKIIKLLMLSPSGFCPPPNDDFDPYEFEMNLTLQASRNTKRHVYEILVEKGEQGLLQYLKQQIRRQRPQMTEADGNTLANYRMKIIFDQDLA